MVKLLENRQIELKYRNVAAPARRRAAQALARIIQVGDDEDAEDGRLGRDQAPHADLAAQFVRQRHLGLRYCSAMQSSAAKRRLSVYYSYFQSGSSGCFKSHSGRRLRTTGISAKL